MEDIKKLLEELTIDKEDSSFEELFESVLGEKVDDFDKDVEELEESLEILEEASKVKLDKQAKFKSLLVKECMSLAYNQKDPLYSKYKKAEALRKQAITMIVKKYKSKAIPAVRNAMKKK